MVAILMPQLNPSEATPRTGQGVPLTHFREDSFSTHSTDNRIKLDQP